MSEQGNVHEVPAFALQQSSNFNHHHFKDVGLFGRFLICHLALYSIFNHSVGSQDCCKFITSTPYLLCEKVSLNFENFYFTYLATRLKIIIPARDIEQLLNVPAVQSNSLINVIATLRLKVVLASGPGSASEAKARMMAMEQQLSQTIATTKAKRDKKKVSFEKSVSFSDDPPPVPASILSKKTDNRERERDREKERERDRAGAAKNSVSKSVNER